MQINNCVNTATAKIFHAVSNSNVDFVYFITGVTGVHALVLQ